MTLEKELINKSFHQTFMEGNKNEHPIKVLGDMYLDERQNEMTELSSIRFAQGEVYFLNHDFEAAIFKWENISNDLKPWALKNIGDAHYEMDLLAIAEDYYTAVETESDVLKAEVLLQLFSLYMRLEKLDLAVDAIKNAVQSNPDYSDVTDLARAFFEDHQDWDNAVELAVSEAMRTESPSWFAVLEEYVVHGHTVKIEPNYFSDVLMNLYHVDQARFESLTVALWYSYKQSDLYFEWLKEINDLLLNIEIESPYTWKVLTALYKDTYFELISGAYLIKDFSQLIPNHLSNWLKISTAQDTLISSSAVLSWSEMFPSDMDDSVVNHAENLLGKAPRYQNIMEDGLGLFESIVTWAKQENMILGERTESIARELLDLNHYNLLIAGSVTSGESTFMNMLLDEEHLNDLNSVAEQAATDEELRPIPNFSDFRSSSQSRQAIIPCRMPVNENKLALNETPLFIEKLKENELQHLQLADSLLFVLSEDSYITGKELDLAFRIKKQVPKLSIHFLLWETANSQEAMEQARKTVAKIDEYFHNAKVIAFSEYGDLESRLNELSSFARSIMEGNQLEEDRSSKILNFIKMSIKSLLERRVEMENSIIDKMTWNEEIATKIKGAQNQLVDMEEQKGQVITRSYSKILDELRQDLVTKIPELLRHCSEMVSADSNFGNIHVELNEEMNKRITNYIEETALPDFKSAVQDWIQLCEGEFTDSQAYLDELSESFNQLYGEEKMALYCDFKVLEDWRRDVDRMTRGKIQLEKANILLRSTPSQLLLKSAGKLFGALSKNKDILHHKYKQFIESKDYSQTAELITEKFLQQFELLGNSLERDINMFFSTSFEVLNRSLVETKDDIEENKESLSDMRKNPEQYRDPLTLFELRLRQYEWMSHEVLIPSQK